MSKLNLSDKSVWTNENLESLRTSLIEVINETSKRNENIDGLLVQLDAVYEEKQARNN